MIRYRLICNKSHEFEAWFGSSAAYDRQARKGHVECPECGSKKVSKAMMAPQVSPRSRKGRGRADAEARGQEAPATSPTPEAVPAPVAPPSPETLQRAEAQRQLLSMMRQLRQEVASKAEYVGPRFAEEARRIHDKEAEARGIWGEATLAEARELHEDGIECLPLPRLPEDGN